jgi:hypothetical protein
MAIYAFSQRAFLNNNRPKEADMKVVLLMAGLALWSFASPACASWAENANMRHPVFTGTDRSLARARHGLDPTTMGHGYFYYYPRRYYRVWR